MAKRSESLYREVYRALRGRILSGVYPPGARIETEPQLATQFRASLITIRQAQRMLVEEGLLDKQQGRGTFVPASVARRLKVLCVCGLDLAAGLQRQMGSYYSDLIVLSQQEAARRGLEFEAVWLAGKDSERARPYGEEPAIREHWGFVFIACRPDHPLLQRVRELGLRYAVITSHSHTGGHRVWLDHPEAIRLALAVFDEPAGEPPLVFGIDNLRKDVEAVLQATGRTARQEYVPGTGSRFSFETAGYLRTLELVREGVDLSRIVLLDDVVAQGVTRALLKAGYTDRNVRLAVICGRQEIIPLGLPATYVVHDTEEEVRHAFAILEQSGGASGAGAATWRSGYRIAAAAEVPPGDSPERAAGARGAR